MTLVIAQPTLDFYTYPPVGGDDWRYIYQTAVVRSLETQMLSVSELRNMANSQSLEDVIGMLDSTDYSLLKEAKDITRIQELLVAKRASLRNMIVDLIIDKAVSYLFRARDDFANLKLALRRKLTDREVGADYSSDGNVAPELYEEVFQEEHYELFPQFMQQAVEQAILAYYDKKDVREIDYSLDAFEAEYYLKQAYELKNKFLISLFRIQIDLTNIRTMLRLKCTEAQKQDVFIANGFIPLEKFREGSELDNESIDHLFFATPYFQIVEDGSDYLAENNSFLHLEYKCEEYLNGFLKSTSQITAGPQPVIAYLLRKENEIRTVRLILVSKRNFLETKLILDRLGVQ